MEFHKKNVLIISQYFKPDVTAAAFRINDLFETLSQMEKYDVDIITTYPHKSELQTKELHDGKNIFRIDVSKNINNRFQNYLYKYFFFAIKAVFLSQKLKERYDYIFVTSPPIFILISGFILSKVKRAKLIIDIRDIWPDSAVGAEMLSKESVFYKITKKVEVFMYNKADYLTCVSEAMKEYISQYVETKKVTVIYNGISKKDIHLVEKIKEANFPSGDSRRKDYFNIFYAGNIGLVQNLDILIKSFQKFIELTKKFQIHLVGDGAKKWELLQYAEKSNIKVHFYGSMSKEDTIIKIINEADILFINLNTSEVFEKTIPSKVFDYLIFDLPIIFGIKGEGKSIFDSLKCGLYFDGDSSEDLKDALIKLDKDYEIYKENASFNFEYVKKNFNRNKSFEDYFANI